MADHVALTIQVLERTPAVLERTPAVLEAMLAGLDESWTHHRYGPETFSPYHVVGHLHQIEKIDWIARIERILEFGGSKAFDPVPHTATVEPETGPPLTELLDQFARLRESNVGRLRAFGLGPSDMDRPGLHPGLGPVTLGQLISTWAAHDLHHIAQVCKGMAFQRREAVGPWREYLKIIPAG